jgi:3-hydroxy-3-methylglutaryl CoA synthase
MDVRLVRRGLNDMKIKLNTPFGDGISDSEVTIDFAKTKDSFKNMGEVENLINEKTKELVSKYENLLKENNNKNSEEEIQVDVKNEAVVDND